LYADIANVGCPSGNISTDRSPNVIINVEGILLKDLLILIGNTT
jgi:hypothetical protein